MKSIELSEKEIGIVKCALSHYKDFCTDCIVAFSETLHEEYFENRGKDVEKLKKRLYQL